jgi:hypothetical protein
VAPVPDRLLLRKSGSAGNRTLDLSISGPEPLTTRPQRLVFDGYNAGINIESIKMYENLLTSNTARPINAICQTPIVTTSTDQIGHVCSVAGKMMLQ